VPQQGPRVAVGDQGGRGARLNPLRRLTFAGAGLIAGGAVVAIGSKLTWATVTLKAAPVSAPGLPPVVLDAGRLTLDAAALASGWVFGLGLLLALVPLGWLVLGWRGRLVLGVVAFAVAAGVFYQVVRTRSDIPSDARRITIQETSVRDANLRIATGPGVGITAGGAVIAALAAVWGGTVGRAAPRLGLPERPGGEGGP
jgi:hypothetical protein